MKRTNIMLDDDQHRSLKAYARKEGRTIGGLDIARGLALLMWSG